MQLMFIFRIEHLTSIFPLWKLEVHTYRQGFN